MQPDISFDFLATQTCTNCHLPVTCGPVYVINDSSILCGRCRMTAKDHYRNYAYEALASCFSYPCKNWESHCPVQLKWNESLDHEPDCDYSGCCTFCCHHPGAFFKGKRHYPEDEIRIAHVPENLLEYLECVICGSYLNSTPVFIQSNGQNVCHRCVHANGNPPNCRRNLSYESFGQIFLFPCAYRSRGCQERHQYGSAIWKHEARCQYRPSLTKSVSLQEERFTHHLLPHMRPISEQPRLQPTFEDDEPRPSATRPIKEKGLIKTHSGHIWATITPQKALFAPPDEHDEQRDINKQLIQSMVKKQGRQIRRVDDIGGEMGRRNSEAESISTNESFSIKTSGNSTPDPHHMLPRRPYIPPEDYLDSRPGSRESGYQTAMRYPESPGTEPVREQFPVLFPHQLNDGLDLGRRTSNRMGEQPRVSKRDSGAGKSLLINELKLRQDMIKRTHSIKGAEGGKSTWM
ncbi:uncharacterized protein LOC126747016 [Anthonomus grandis grandis]|uniref:uncharacterized protein LOC126747016 n=1 Tax=Anthonomus grandis grandis TaxID=2921223 RepID=UPI0021654E75|nr:uncharacterized protein LOC126747016 [Anthonomus grandis grandis]